jgi:hypothetical protein
LSPSLFVGLQPAKEQAGIGTLLFLFLVFWGGVHEEISRQVDASCVLCALFFIRAPINKQHVQNTKDD